MKTLLAIAMLTLMFQQSPQSQTGTIEGVVTRTDRTTPLADVHIELEERFPSTRIQTPFSAEATTDSNGHFIIRDVPASDYTLQASLEEYLGNVRGLHGENATASLHVRPGQSLRVSGLILTATGAIRGRLLDADGGPVREGGVVVFQKYIDDRGEAAVRQIGRFLQTNAEGQFEVLSLAPGEYYLRASATVSGQREISVYFPATLEASAALPIRVFEGSDAIADIRIPKNLDAATFRISGRVIFPHDTAYNEPFLSVSLKDQEKSILQLSTSNFTTADDSTGYFEFSRVRPGRYDLSSIITAKDKRFSGALLVDVRDHNVDDVTLSLLPGIDIKAHLETDEESQNIRFSRPPASIVASVLVGEDRSERSDATIRVAMQPKSFPLRINPVVNEDATEMVFASVPEGDCGFVVSIEAGRAPLDSDLYVKDVRVAGRSVYDSGIRVGVDPADVRIVIGTHGGSVSGTIPATNDSSTTVILIPEYSRRGNLSLYRQQKITASAGPAAFMLRGIPPGNYKIFAIADEGNDLPIRNAEFASQYDSRGVNVTVEKGAVVGGLQLPVLPLEH